MTQPEPVTDHVRARRHLDDTARWRALAVTITVIAVVAGAELLGLVEAARARRNQRTVQRLPALAVGIAGIVGGVVGTAAFHAGWW